MIIGNISVDEMVIAKNEISCLLQQRWIACYMLYDWNPSHADNAFYNNEFERYKEVFKRLTNESALPSSAALMTDAYNKVLAEDVESFIQTHMEVSSCSRAEVEIQIVRALIESGEVSIRA